MIGNRPKIKDYWVLLLPAQLSKLRGTLRQKDEKA